mgnify:CR=1 FL=1
MRRCDDVYMIKLPAPKAVLPDEYLATTGVTTDPYEIVENALEAEIFPTYRDAKKAARYITSGSHRLADLNDIRIVTLRPLYREVGEDTILNLGPRYAED